MDERFTGSAAIEEWRPAFPLNKTAHADLAMLAGVLHAAVHAGASVSFILPFSAAEALAFWHETVLRGLAAGTRRVVVARSGGRIVGTVQVDLATPPNQVHRAEVANYSCIPKSGGGASRGR